MLVAIRDPRRPKKPSAMAKTTRLKRWGPRQCEATCVFRNLLFQQLCLTESQRRSPRDQLLRPEAKDSPIHYESPAPPPSSDHSWVLVTWKFLLYVHRSEVAYGGGGGGGGDERVKARPRIPPEKDRRERGPPPEQCKC